VIRAPVTGGPGPAPTAIDQHVLAADILVLAGPIGWVTNDLDAINFALHQFRERAPWSTRNTPRPPGHPPRTDVAERLLGRLSASASVVESSAIAVLVEAIEANGGVAVVNTEREARFDLGVWSDDLEAIGGNPLLVEMKRSLVPGAVHRVVSGLNAHPSARLALLVYLEPTSRRISKASTASWRRLAAARRFAEPASLG